MNDLSGIRFNKLTVIRFSGKRGSMYYWECKCDCGKIKLVASENLKSGSTKSCGCLRATRLVTHGKAFSLEHHSWTQMKQRCRPDADKPHREAYFEKGVKVCDRWLNSFENFYSDMGPRPSKYHSLDRFPDPNGDYKPGNCRWATMKEQCNNRRNNRIIEFNGLSLTLSQWSEKLGVSRNTLRNRMDRQGWSAEKAFTVNVKGRCTPI